MAEYPKTDGNGHRYPRRAYVIDGSQADGPYVPEIGQKEDTAFAGGAAGSVIAVLKGIYGKLGAALSVTPAMASGGNLAPVNTNTGTPATYTAFAAQACKQLTLCSLDADIEFQQGGAGSAMIIPMGTPFTIFGLTNSNQIGVRRKDASTTAATVYARWET